MRINIEYSSSPPRVTEHTARIQDLFGIGLKPHTVIVVSGLDIDVDGRRLILITGPSGTGKSSILKALKERLKERAIDADELNFLGDVALIDSLSLPFSESLELLSLVGLGEAHLMLRPYAELSEGQRLRARIARAIAEAERDGRTILIDEFCSTLDRLTASIVSYNLRRIVNRRGLAVVVATSIDDIIDDLQPDMLILPKGGGRWFKRERKVMSRPISFFDRLYIRRGGISDWRLFAHLHYKSHHTGIVDRIYVLYLDGRPIGIVVYAYPMMALKLRNLVTDNRYAGSAVTAGYRKRLLNEEVRVVQRIVIDPLFRGLGLAAALLRSTMPLLGVRFVECLAVMGGYSRFLQKAGFLCIGRCGLSREGRMILGELRSKYPNTVLHDEELLLEILREESNRSPIFKELLRRWFRSRSYIKGAETTSDTSSERFIKKVAETLVKELTSRAFYFICDLHSYKEGNDEDRGVGLIRVEGE